MKIQSEIKQEIDSEPGFIVGFADIEGLPDKRFDQYKYAISIGKGLDDSIIDCIAGGPTSHYYDLYKRMNKALETKLSSISALLEKAGIAHLQIKPTMDDDELDEDYVRTLRTPFSHKLAATRAGLGWIGKTDLLISREFGPRLRLASILIEKSQVEFEVSQPITKSKCGNCDICVTECPAQAATGGLWDVTVDRDEFYNAFRCREKCRELSGKNININASICGICISVCPIGNKNKTKN